MVNNSVMRISDTLFERLGKSSFRSRFRLGAKELSYLHEKGIDTVMEHAVLFLRERIAPANIPGDGRQTPMKNHPVFIAQHATATCCRKCMEKWHGIKKGHDLTDEEMEYLLLVIKTWLSGFV